MPAWLWLSLLTIFLWGGWGLQSKLIAERISPWMNQVLFTLGLLPLVVWILFSKNLHTGVSLPKGGASLSAQGFLGARVTSGSSPPWEWAGKPRSLCRSSASHR